MDATFSLSTIDIVIMIVYAFAIIGYGLYHSKRQNSEEYFLGGRDMVWPIVGISLFAANISSSTLVGLASDAFMTNTHVYNYEWMAVVVLIIFAIFFMPFYLNSRVYTMPEFLERRYDSRARYYFSFVTLIANIIVDAAAGLYVGMLVMKLVLPPEIETWMIVVILAFAAAAYTIPGGLSAVIQTEVIQAILLIIGSIVLTYFCFDAVGGWSGMIDGLSEFRGRAPVGDQTPEEILSLVRPASDEYMPWTGLLFGVPILGFYFWATNQFMVQRVLGAKDLNHGRWGALFAGFLKLPVIFFMVLPGTMAILLFSDLDLTNLNYEIMRDGESVICANLKDCPNMTYPLLLFQLLPTGMLGLVLAGLLAAMMSSVSATLNSASTLITRDFILKFRPDLENDQKKQVLVGQIATLVLVILAAIWAPQIERLGSLFEYLQRVIAFTCPPVVAVFVLGLFWKRANGTGAIVGLLVGFAAAIFLLVLEINGTTTGLLGSINSIHFLHKAAYLLLICALLQVVVSLMTEEPNPEQVKNYVWTKANFEQDTRDLEGVVWYKNYRILAVLLVIATAIMVGWFW